MACPGAGTHAGAPDLVAETLARWRG